MTEAEIKLLQDPNTDPEVTAKIVKGMSREEYALWRRAIMKAVKAGSVLRKKVFSKASETYSDALKKAEEL